MKNITNYLIVFILLAFSYVFFISCGSSGGSGSATLSALLISPSSVTVSVNSTQKFSALGLYSDNSIKALSASWAVTGSLGTVGATSGIFYASSVGSCEIIATYEAITGTATITTTLASSTNLASITVSPTSYSGRVGQVQTFTASGASGSGESVSIAPTWSVSGAIGTITATGTFTATAEGTGSIICTSGEVSTTVTATISGYYAIVTAEADTYVDSANATVENSTSNTLIVSYSDSTTHIQDSYISFDVSSIAAAATIESATLYLYVDSADSNSYVLKKITNSWAPTITYSSKPATGAYSYITSMDNPTWSAYNGVSITDTVADWVATPASNLGIYLYKPTSNDGGMTFLSTESSFKPYIVITYQ